MSRFVELLGEELGKQVQEKLGDGFIIGKEENYIAKHRFDEVNEQLGEYKKMLSDRDNQLEELKKKAGDNEELNQRIQELEEQNKTTAEEYESQLAAQKFDFELEKAIREAGARNPKAVKALLNTDEIKLEDGKLTGLDAQLEKLQKDEDYLFGEVGLKGKDHDEGDGKLDQDYKENPWEPGKVSLTKQSEILDENPGKAKKLIEKAGGNPSDYGL
ncbi:scaffolding protein [Iocasia frigidifontis]|uniref:Scaffolding protein n=1 Tax=Iocasia fonsfrigidae TaxID=2682810 RepID=A0A8A7K4A7_9FIRM|nr:phage scaffolding protein [Iocasia fonsfrigidae]QTL96553.1 scaffolding protein [Iocasia fonsfrigidae]